MSRISFCFYHKILKKVKNVLSKLQSAVGNFLLEIRSYDKCWKHLVDGYRRRIPIDELELNYIWSTGVYMNIYDSTVKKCHFGGIDEYTVSKFFIG